MAKRKPTRNRKPARKKAAAPAKLPRPSVATVVINEATRQAHKVMTRARPPHIARPKRIHSRRFPPRLLEGEERAFHSTTEPLAAIAVPEVAPAEDVEIILDTELTGPGQQRTASNVGEPSVAMSGDVVFYTGNWYAAISLDRGKTFRFIDPSTAFQQFDPPGTSFCCDQVVHYIADIATFV
jgi:hypothetical protein